MALCITRTIGRSVLFHAKGGWAKVELIGIHGSAANFAVSNPKSMHHAQRSRGQVLHVGIGGHDVRLGVAEVKPHRVSLSIDAPETVQVAREELLREELVNEQFP